MWFKRKTRNRRLHGGTVLDVKLRSDQARAHRMRATAIGLGFIFGAIVCVFAVWRAGEWALNQMVFENPAFSIADVDARTDGVILPDQIKRWAGAKIGDNLMALDLARVKRDLELVPLVQSVSVERVLPRTLRIRVTERQAVAQVNVPRARAGGGLDVVVMHLDVDGYVFPPLDPHLRSTPLGQMDDMLPVLTGVNPLALQPGWKIDAPAVLVALDLINKFQESPMAAFTDMKRVDVSSPDVLIATTGQGSEITFGQENLDQQLLRWREIYEQGMRYHRAIATLDLAVSNNIPARWLEATAVPAAAPRQTKPPRTRKKNV